MFKFRFTILSALVALVWVLLPFTTSALTISKTPANTLQTGLVGWWTFDGKDWASPTVILDKTANVNTGTLSGSVIKLNGKIGQAIKFNSGTYFSVPSTNFDTSSAQISVATWLKFNSTGGWQGVITKRSCCSDASVFQWSLQTNNDNRLWWGIRTAANTYWTQGNTLDSKWRYVVGTYDGQRVKIYENGIFIASTTATGSILNQSGIPVVFGARADGGSPYTGRGDYFAGSLDDIRVYNRALSAAEVQALYKQGGGVINKTDLIKAQLRTGLVEQLTFDGKDFSDATHAVDKSGRSNTGTLNGTLSKVNGKIGQALSFPGLASANITMADSSTLNPGSGDFTVSTWFKYYGIVDTAHDVFIYNDYGSNTNNLVNLVISYPGNQLYATYRDGSGNDILVSGAGPTVNDRKWHHAVWTKSGQTGYLYIDGLFIASNTDNLIGTITTSDANPPMIGRYSQDANNIGMFRGLMDDFRIYSRALSATEVQELYKQGGGKISKTDLIRSQLRTGLVGHWTFDGKDWASNIITLDKSGSNNSGTLIGGVTKVNGKIGQAMKFDGSTGYVSSGMNNIGGNNYTYSAWVKLKTLPASGAYYTILGVSDGDQNFLIANDYNVTWHYTGFGFGSYYNSSSGDTVGYNGTLPVINKWYHVVSVRNTANNTLKLYVNGVQIGSVVLSSATAYYGGTSAVYIGRRVNVPPSYDGYFNGAIDDVRIYNRALSAQEVYQLYKMGK